MIPWGHGNRPQVAPPAQENQNVLSKLLNMRDFRPVGVSPCAQNALQFHLWQMGKALAWSCFHRHGISCQDAPLAGPDFVPT
jgi:hypothetical protein